MADRLAPVQIVAKPLNEIAELKTLSITKLEHHRTSDHARSPEAVEISVNDGTALDSQHENRNDSIQHRAHPASESKGPYRSAALRQTHMHNRLPKSLADEAGEILQNRPDYDALNRVLNFLQDGIEGLHDFNIRCNGPKASQIINTLVTSTLPNHWPTTSQYDVPENLQRAKAILLSCVTSVAGIGALVANIRMLSDHSGADFNTRILEIVIAALSEVLEPVDILSTLLHDVLKTSKTETVRVAVWRELCALLGGGKVLAAVWQAESKLSAVNKRHLRGSWIASGVDYSTWLARRTGAAVMDDMPQQHSAMSMLAQLLRHGLSLGHRGSDPL